MWDIRNRFFWIFKVNWLSRAVLPKASIPQRLSIGIDSGSTVLLNLNKVPDKINSTIKIYGAMVLALSSFLIPVEIINPNISAAYNTSNNVTQNSINVDLKIIPCSG